MANIDAEIYAIVKANPGITGAGIYQVRRARSRAAKWFGIDSIWTTIFGGSLVSIYEPLARLEGANRICSEWSVGMPGRGYRSRRYWIR